MMTPRQDPIGVYCHVPFCERRCHFCGFFTQGYRDDLAAAFVQDLLQEIRLYSRDECVRGRSVETIYFGGGTPTTLTAQQLLEILNTCRYAFSVDPQVEVTVEANPATVDERSLAALVEGGFTRISFGAQSFDDPELRSIGAAHTTEQIRKAVRAAHGAGFSNVNLDLIYGLPGQSLARWRENLTAALALTPAHISFYGLSIEGGTKFERDLGCGQLKLNDEDLLVEMYVEGRAMLESAGYRQYEVSNFAQPGRRCRHNLGYWSDREWLGLGPAAHSYLSGDRFRNVESLAEYHRLIDEGHYPVSEREPGSAELRLREALAFGLRNVQGVELGPLGIRYGAPPLARFQEAIARLTQMEWVSLEGEILRPTAAGLLFADELAMAFL